MALNGGSSTVSYVDADGHVTDDPASAVRGESVTYDEHGILRRRTRFVLIERDISWLPVGETAFLLWVLVILMSCWLAVGLVLFLT